MDVPGASETGDRAWLDRYYAERLADVARGEGKRLEVNGKKVAAYRDETGALSALSPICTHLKCVIGLKRGGAKLGLSLSRQSLR